MARQGAPVGLDRPRLASRAHLVRHQGSIHRHARVATDEAHEVERWHGLHGLRLEHEELLGGEPGKPVAQVHAVERVGHVVIVVVAHAPLVRAEEVAMGAAPVHKALEADAAHAPLHRLHLLRHRPLEGVGPVEDALPGLRHAPLGVGPQHRIPHQHHKPDELGAWRHLHEELGRVGLREIVGARVDAHNAVIQAHAVCTGRAWSTPARSTAA
mmetsp:Transcript_25036/g.78015  ORF Transcript_25036/g.78015 Transcript_25036/m.78015 type:complete len:213 (+) Transcript_25036:355-993(+)